jgi:predicted Fe-S protein YdhL (DUF1289 family)
MSTKGHDKCASLSNETLDARAPSLRSHMLGEGGRVSLREFHVKGIARCLSTIVLTGLVCLPMLAEAETWAELTPVQQEALAPLSKDWNTLANKQQQHFIKLSNHYGKLTPEKKERLHKQLVAWSKLTPEQRKRAREKYIAFSKVPPEKREQVKQMLREQEARKAAASSVQPALATH